MKIEFTAFPRTAQGTGASRRLRGAGKVPGIVYGANKSAEPIEVDHHALYRHLKLEAFHASILDMSYEGAKQQVLLRDVQMHPFRPLVLHVDFQRIDKNEKIHMKVPLHFTNAEICPGVKQGGGVVNHIMNEADIHQLVLSKNIPGNYGEVELKETHISWALLSGVVRRRIVRGELVSRERPPASWVTQGAGPRAWTVLVASFSPNAYVVDVDPEERRVLLHDLVRYRKSEEPA